MVALFAAAVLGCDRTPRCLPGTRGGSCECAGGGTGQYMCGADGTRFTDECLCEPAEAGVDAGTDAGIDAGADAGVDAGTDAGVDAGTDAGVDADAGS